MGLCYWIFPLFSAVFLFLVDQYWVNQTQVTAVEEAEVWQLARLMELCSATAAAGSGNQGVMGRCPYTTSLTLPVVNGLTEVRHPERPGLFYALNQLKPASAKVKRAEQNGKYYLSVTRNKP